MLPAKLRNSLFDRLSGVTMRPSFTPLAVRDAVGLVRDVLEQSEQDFFVNGTITCHASNPELMAGLWSGGREASLVDDRLPAWEKIAMGAALSQENRCPYCEDFLLSLTHGADQNAVAVGIRTKKEVGIEDPQVRARLNWARSTVGEAPLASVLSVFEPDQLPEAIGTILVFCYTNKISDFAMNGSPVPTFGRATSLRLFGSELKASAQRELEPGASLTLLPPGEVPVDLDWARANPRVADALARWCAAVERAAATVVSPAVRSMLDDALRNWAFGHPPISRGWTEAELGGLRGKDRAIGRLALLVAKASYQVDDALLAEVSAAVGSEAALLSVGAWAALRSARRVAQRIAETAFADLMAPREAFAAL